jgi:hypothetical protein
MCSFIASCVRYASKASSSPFSRTAALIHWSGRKCRALKLDKSAISSLVLAERREGIKAEQQIRCAHKQTIIISTERSHTHTQRQHVIHLVEMKAKACIVPALYCAGHAQQSTQCSNQFIYLLHLQHYTILTIIETIFICVSVIHVFFTASQTGRFTPIFYSVLAARLVFPFAFRFSDK